LEHSIQLTFVKYKPLFLDTEFNELRQSASLVSLALVSETDDSFYAEFTDVDYDGMSSWHKENVVENLFLDNPEIKAKKSEKFIRSSKDVISVELLDWIGQLSKKYGGQTFQIWADVPHYDWVFFCELFGGARYLPSFIHYMPMDIATLLMARNEDPTKDRLSLIPDFQKRNLKPHNALFDANIAKALYYKFINP
jgi:hypothetical protein